MLGMRRIAAGVAAVAAAAALVTACGHAAGTRPVWNGRGAYASPVQPMCPAADQGLYAAAGERGHRFTVRCDQDGAVYVWDAVSGQGGR